MLFDEESIIYPLPPAEHLDEFEKLTRITLPGDYRQFLQTYNGARPIADSFVAHNHSWAIDRFLCKLEDYEDHPLGMYDLGVTWTQLDERLSDGEDTAGIKMLPIAVLFAGDFVCMDFRKTRKDGTPPTLCVWLHEESDIFAPATYKIDANSFTEFLEMLE
jgi:hypothetical protein